MQSVFFLRHNNNAWIIKLVVPHFFKNEISDPSACKAQGILRIDRTREAGKQVCVTFVVMSSQFGEEFDNVLM